MSLKNAKMPRLIEKLETLADLKEKVEVVTEEVKKAEDEVVKKTNKNKVVKK